MSRLTFKVTCPAPRDVWREVVGADPAAFVYQTPRGLDSICTELEAEDVSRLYEFSDGRRAILPLYRSRKTPPLVAVVRSPGVGSVAAPGGPRVEELRAIFEDLQRNNRWRTVIQPFAAAGRLWAQAAPARVGRQPHVSHVLDLAGGFDAVWKSKFNNQAKRAIKKAEKSTLEIECDDSGRLLPELLDLLELSIERWAGQRREPLFVARWRSQRRDSPTGLAAKVGALGDACRIWVARVERRPAAAIMVLQGTNAHYTRGAMDIDLAGPVRANFLLHKLAIEDACRSECRYYNMGETGASESLARFKSHFGAEAHEFSGLCFERFPITGAQRRLKRLTRALLKPRPRGSA